ncbi:pilus assembly protein TadG-related protein [Mesorhizobium sp. ES1-3]|uniref:pilus assembly protein TadG-related protein n=1 Tax=Mesorhizobium sp. ES1-3 TaxID=2876628 RepID=UPI0021E1D5A9|nr:pilus assembly protein TadG-related protein [Mesorhizobium sp. ES1-3]
MQILRRFVRNRDGNVLIMSALLLPVLIGMAALVTEYGGALVERAGNQRTADLAAYAGALAYNATKSTDLMTAAAVNVATLNGVPAADVQAALVTSPKTSGMNAVSVSIRTQKQLLLARVLNDRQQLQIYANAVAELGAPAQTPGCMLALDGTQTGITLSGGTKITAPKCTVSSNNTVTVPCGTSISAIGVNYNSAAPPSQPCNGITGPNGTAAVIAKKSTPDPLAGNTAIAAAVARFSTVAAMSTTTAPAAPTNSTGNNIDFAWNQGSTQGQATALGCTASWASPTSTWTLNCGSTTTVNIGTITIGGGINLNFATSGAATTVYNIAGDLTTSATTNFGPGTYNFAKTLTTAGTTTFGAGTYNIGKQVTTAGTTTFGAGNFNFTKGLTTGGGATTTFGAGTFKFGISDNTCGGIARVSLCNTSKLTFGGPSTFELPGGLNNTGGAVITFGSGTSNSYKIGPGGNGDAITLGGGSTTIMADATSSGVFQVIGNVNGGGGGSCFVVPATAQHDIEGNFIASGAVLLGAGVYTIDGYFALGGSGGGSASCGGSTISVSGVNVTLVLSGKAKSSSGSCNGYVFCVAAGYSNIVLTAPQTGATAKLAVIGPTSTSVTAGATFAEGGSNAQISGAFYFPYGPIIMNGGSSVLGSPSDSSKCLQMIGSLITLSGGTAAASECIAASSSSASNKVSLVQ